MHAKYREQHDEMMELEAYDSIGIEYYYLGNIEKSIYYHNRMMNGEIEKESSAKDWSLEELKKDRHNKAFKQLKKFTTVFELYHEALMFGISFEFPHESKENIA